MVASQSNHKSFANQVGDDGAVADRLFLVVDNLLSFRLLAQNPLEYYKEFRYTYKTKKAKGEIIGELWLVKITEIFGELWEELDG